MNQFKNLGKITKITKFTNKQIKKMSEQLFQTLGEFIIDKQDDFKYSGELLDL